MSDIGVWWNPPSRGGLCGAAPRPCHGERWGKRNGFRSAPSGPNAGGRRVTTPSSAQRDQSADRVRAGRGRLEAARNGPGLRQMSEPAPPVASAGGGGAEDGTAGNPRGRTRRAKNRRYRRTKNQDTKNRRTSRPEAACRSPAGTPRDSAAS